MDGVGSDGSCGDKSGGNDEWVAMGGRVDWWSLAALAALGKYGGW